MLLAAILAAGGMVLGGVRESATERDVVGWHGSASGGADWVVDGWRYSRAVSSVSAPAGLAFPGGVTGVVCWLDASHAGSLTVVGDEVVFWEDLSGVSAGVARTADPWHGPSVGSMGGLTAVSFDGGTQALSNVWDYAVSDCTLVAAMRWDSFDVSDEDFPVSFGQGGVGEGAVRGLMVKMDGNVRLATWVADMPEETGAGRGSVGDSHVWAVRLSGTSASARVDGSEGVGAELVFSEYRASYPGLGVGGMFSMDVPIATRLSVVTIGEAVFYNRALGDVELSAVIEELMTKWSVTAWEAPPEVYVTVSFDGMGGFVPEGEESKVVLVGGSYGTLPVPVYDGYTFNGWYSYDLGVIVDEWSTVTLGSDHTLSATWY